MVVVKYYNQHHDPFIHHRHGIVDLNFNIMNHIAFIVLLLNFFFKTYSLNILIVLAPIPFFFLRKLETVSWNTVDKLASTTSRNVM